MYKVQLLASLLAIVGLVTAGGGGDTQWETQTQWMTTTSCTTSYWTETYTTTVVVDKTTTTYVPSPTTYTQTTTETKVPPAVTVIVTSYSTVFSTGVSVEVVPTTVVVTSTEVQVGTVTTTEVQVGTVTSLSLQSEEITIYITSTSVPPAATITTTDVVTTSVTNSVCEFCKIGITGQEVAYPFSISVTTLTATTLVLHTTHGANTTIVSTETILAPSPCTDVIPTVWDYSGIAMTSPTTYLVYTSFELYQLSAKSGVYGCGELVSTTLDLGPSGASDLAARVVPTLAFTPVIPAPAEIVYFLENDATVEAQLNGVPAGSCDDLTASCSTTITSTTQTVVSATVAPGTTTLNAVDILEGLG